MRKLFQLLATTIAVMGMVVSGALAAENDPPRLLAAGVPASTASQWITVNPHSGEDGGVCRDLRIANEDGVWGNWGACKARPHLLSHGYGFKGVFLQARNEYGLSNTVFLRVTYAAPSGSVPVPGPENIPPKLVPGGVPATTTNRWITVNPHSSDTGGACKEVRIANEDGVWGNWGMCKAQPHLLSVGHGFKGVFLQARNEFGLSNILYQRVTFSAATVGQPLPAAYQGWATVIGTTPASIWKWTGAGWAPPTTIPAGTRVYGSPFQPGWHWVWYAGAWNAMRSASLLTG